MLNKVLTMCSTGWQGDREIIYTVCVGEKGRRVKGRRETCRNAAREWYSTKRSGEKKRQRCKGYEPARAHETSNKTKWYAICA